MFFFGEILQNIDPKSQEWISFVGKVMQNYTSVLIFGNLDWMESPKLV